MPTYDYLCNDCDYKFEEFQSITAEPLDKCPKCSGRVQRLISSGNGLIFKGSGFYITDYKKPSRGPEKKSSVPNKSTKSEKSASKPSKESSKTE